MFCFQLKEQLLSSQDDGRSCLLEAVASTGWLSRGPHLQPALIDLLDSVWDVFERMLDGHKTLSGAHGFLFFVFFKPPEG